MGSYADQSKQSRLASHGFRRTDRTASLVWPIDPLNGVDPRVNLVMVEVPDTQVIDAIVELWACIRPGDCPR